MDSDNNEGVIGTESGSIYYINLAERTNQKLVSSNNKNHDAIKCLKIDPTMTKTFYVSCGRDQHFQFCNITIETYLKLIFKNYQKREFPD